MQDANSEKPDKRTIEDAYSIDADELYRKSTTSDYWAASHKFFEQVKTELYTTLSPKQRTWLMKIERALNKELNR